MQPNLKTFTADASQAVLALFGGLLLLSCLDGSGRDEPAGGEVCTSGGCPTAIGGRTEDSPEGNEMSLIAKSAAGRSSIPPIDAGAPATTETATFALG